eukprot:scaffold139775_cov28-Tisochrysis_lutea.AAC.4
MPGPAPQTPCTKRKHVRTQGIAIIPLGITAVHLEGRQQCRWSGVQCTFWNERGLKVLAPPNQAVSRNVA